MVSPKGSPGLSYRRLWADYLLKNTEKQKVLNSINIYLLNLKYKHVIHITLPIKTKKSYN